MCCAVFHHISGQFQGQFSTNFQQTFNKNLGFYRIFFVIQNMFFLSGMEKTISRLLTVPCRWCFWKRVDAETGLLSICKNISVSLNNLEKQNSCFFLLFKKGCQSKKSLWSNCALNTYITLSRLRGVMKYHCVFEVKRPKPFHHNVTMTAR